MPARFATVEQYLEAQTPDQRDVIESLRTLVKQAEPAVIEGVKWNSPNYVLRGIDRLTINATGRGPVRLILHFGTGRAEDKNAASAFAGDPDGLLTWHSDIRASLVAPPADDVQDERAAILAVIRAWLDQP